MYALQNACCTICCTFFCFSVSLSGLRYVRKFVKIFTSRTCLFIFTKHYNNIVDGVNQDRQCAKVGLIALRHMQ